MAPIILYHNCVSTPSRFALLAFRNLGIDVEIRNVDLLKKEQLKPEFLKINPQHTVPTMDDNGFVLWESGAIAQYLAETYAKDSPLYPQDTKKKALVNQRLQFYLGTMLPRMRQVTHPILFEGLKEIPEVKRKLLYDAFGFLDQFLNGSDWLAGDHVTLADLSILANITTIVSFGADISEFKNLSAWAERCKTLPGYDENMEGVKMFTAFFKSFYDGKI
ncbi:hypothetical protein ACFFRR_004561 [Megaselia abdita]